MTPEEELTQFLIDNGEREGKAPLSVESWFYITNLNVRLAETEGALHGFTKKETFEMFSEGMAHNLESEVNCGPEELLQKIRETMAEYLETVDNAGELNPPENATIEPFQTTRANSLVIPNTKAANALADIMNKGNVEIITGRKKSKDPLTEDIKATFIIPGIDGVEIEGKYDGFLQTVFYSFMSLIYAGNKAVTPSMIRQLQSYDFDPNHKITTATNNEITDALTELENNITVWIDMKDEAARCGYDMSRVDALQNGLKMLDLGRLRVMRGGKYETAYYPLITPPLYEQAEIKGQLVTIPAKDLAIYDHTTGKRLRSTNKRIEIVFYLLQQISNMKYDLKRAKDAYWRYNNRRKGAPETIAKKMSNYRTMSTHILFDTVFSKTGLNGKSRTEKRNYREFIKNCFWTWADDKEIKGFEVLHTGNRKDVETGINVLLD